MTLNIIQYPIICLLLYCYCIANGSLGDDDTITFPDKFEAIHHQNVKPTPQLITTRISQGLRRKVGEISKQKCKDVYEHRNNLGGLDIRVDGEDVFEAYALAFPHMAALGCVNNTNITWVCGGSLISKNFILTAAHCAKSQICSVNIIRVGTLNIQHFSEEDNHPQDFTIAGVFIHPDYKPPSVYNDIALMQLDRPAILGYNVQPACLQTEPTVPDWIRRSVLGWGETSFGGPTADHLLVVYVNETDNDLCREGYAISSRRLAKGIDEDTHICAGSKRGDVCQGDSGGPLQIRSNYKTGYVVIGITSFGKGCILTKQPSVFTRVSYYIEWIESIVWPETN